MLGTAAPSGLIFKSAGGTADIVAVGFNRRIDRWQTIKSAVRYGTPGVMNAYRNRAPS